jgi:uncharacterized membrane protein YukC
MIVGVLTSALYWWFVLVGIVVVSALVIVIAMYFKYSRTPRGKRITTTE